jgi:glycerophosphoryl diester phosphodiesterase
VLTPAIIGHRGASVVAPENTLAAFKAAIEAGADGIEFDVRLSRDGVPVIIHDETLYRTHGLRGRIAEMTLNELTKLKVPSLAQLFEVFESNQLLLCLELKETQVQLLEECCRFIYEYRLKDRVIFECFEHSALQTVKNVDPTFRTAALFQAPAPFILKKTLAVGADAVALHYRLINKHLVADARSAGLKVVTWTVDDPTWVKHAQEIGIDALITNNPAFLLAARDA